MKRVSKALCLILVLVLALSFTACSSDELVQYDSATGLSIMMPKGFEEADMAGFTTTFQKRDLAVFALNEKLSDIVSYGFDENITLQEYTDIITTGNGYAASTTNEYGDLYFTYESTVEGSDGFWFVNFVCFSEEQDKYLPLFMEWASTMEAA